MTFQDFLRYASGPGVATIVAVILSLVVEMWPRFNELQPKTRRLVFIALCFGAPTLFALLRVAVGHVALSFDPLVWDALVAGFAAAGIGTLAHTPRLKARPELVRR